MSNEQLLKELESCKNFLKIANAKIQASNHTLISLIGENNELKATIILHQEEKKELINNINNFESKIEELQKKLYADPV